MFMFRKMVPGKRLCYSDYTETSAIGFNFYTRTVTGKFTVLLTHNSSFDIETINGYI